ncbi:MAG: YceI family protein [Polyangiaceae bacterium]|nr:YceI family protein [Polyangiaceae bacterium]
MKIAPAVASLVLLLAVAGCDKKEPASAPPAATSAAVTKSAVPAPAEPAPPSAGHKRLTIAQAKATFLIDAPLEKIKGEVPDGKGFIDLDTADLSRSKGSVSLRLSSLSTSTFADADKNASQTDHARNWLEVGKAASADARAKHEWATFTLKSVSVATPKLADVKEEAGARAFDAKLSGSLSVHGVAADKTFTVKVVVKGPPDAPTEVSLSTSEPWALSLKEHAIAPRDGVGSLLAGALEKIGKKIEDKVQVSLVATAK